MKFSYVDYSLLSILGYTRGITIMKKNSMKPVKTIVWIVIIALAVWGIFAVTKNSNGATVTGTVSYLEKVALPAGAVVEVKLLDLSEQDIDGQVLADQTITTKGENVPIPFSLSYNPSDIDDTRTYSVGARIFIDGDLAWVSTQNYPVITNGYPNTADVFVTDVR